MRPILPLCLLFSALALPMYSAADLLRLEIGDPARKAKRVAVTLDAVTDTATGEVIAPDEMVRRLAGTGILFVGENHTNIDFHDVQFRTIRALKEAGREVLIGLEMFPYTEQASLDNWHGGRYTEEGFVELADWYGNWGYHWNYYRDIFLYAREHGIRMYAVNSPREFVRAVRAKGFTDLTDEEAAHLPPQLAPDSDEHRLMYRAFFDEDDVLHMSESALEGLYRAQTAWDATMGWNALQALQKNGGTDAIMVVLIGAGHATYGLGSERQIAPYYDGRIASLVPVPVVDDDGNAVGDVQASYASFVWGIPEAVDPLYPTLGVSLMGSIGKEPGQVIQVSEGSVAGRAGIQVGDVLLAVDGVPVGSEIVLRRLMAAYRWGDVAKLHVRRAGSEREVEVPLRRESGRAVGTPASSPASSPAR